MRLVGPLVAAEYLIGVGALAPRTRTVAVALGLVLTAAFWALDQKFGELYTGQATDPNSGPVLALMAVALLAGRDVRQDRPIATGRRARARRAVRSPHPASS